MRKLMFILNPQASGFKKFDFKSNIEMYLKEKATFEYDIRCTTYSQEAIKIANDAIKDGFTELIAVGGDGTINEVGNVAVNNDVILGIIPAGTGNDYVNSLREKMDFEYSMEKILLGKTKCIDYGSFLDKSFFNIASVGFDAEVNRNAQKIKKLVKSSLSYKISLILSLFLHKRKHYKIIIDDKEYEDDFFLIAVGIGNFYGGNLNILPFANMTDGLLDVCVIKYKSKFDILKKVKSILNATHINQDITSYFNAKKVKIISKDLEINYDGEYLNNLNEITFEINKNKVNLII